MLWLGRKNKLVNQPPLRNHTRTHDLLMHYENHPDELPPLPVLAQPWADTVRTHTSFQGLPWEPFETPADSEANDYEKLEHVGDALLNRGVGRLITQLYPRLTVGEQTAMLALLIANFSIAFLARAYRLPDGLLAHAAQRAELQANTGVQADLLEAFLGGLYRQAGRKDTVAFVQRVFRPLVEAAYEDRKALWAVREAADKAAAAIQQAERQAQKEADELAPFEYGDDGGGAGGAAPKPLRDHVSLLCQYGARRQEQVSFVKVGLCTMTVRIDDVKAGSFTALEGGKKNWSKIKDLAAKDALINLGILKPDVPANAPLLFVASAPDPAA